MQRFKDIAQLSIIKTERGYSLLDERENYDYPRKTKDEILTVAVSVLKEYLGIKQ